MKKSDDVKEKIINITTELITNGNGNIDEITTRKIAEEANIGIGLINYHFQTKDNLVEICVQRIIGKVISDFKPDVGKDHNSIDRLKYVTKLVADFLMNNQAVARISILGDISNPTLEDNTNNTMKGFNFSLAESGIADNERIVLMFILTSVLQSAFLRKNISSELFGYDFNDKITRDLFIDCIIDRLLKGGKNFE